MFDATGGRKLPRDPGERFSLGVVSLIMAGFAGFIIFVLLITEFPPFGWLVSIMLFVTHELMFGILVFFGLLLIWAVATPRWVERVFDMAWKKLWILIALAILPLIALAVLAAMGMTLESGLEP
jgi:hypothetical protein